MIDSIPSKSKRNEMRRMFEANKLTLLLSPNDYYDMNSEEEESMSNTSNEELEVEVLTNSDVD